MTRDELLAFMRGVQRGMLAMGHLAGPVRFVVVAVASEDMQPVIASSVDALETRAILLDAIGGQGVPQ